MRRRDEKIITKMREEIKSACKSQPNKSENSMEASLF